jgi:hypothetical protein
LRRQKYALDSAAAAVEDRREARLPAPVALGRDVRGSSARLDLPVDGVAVVALVGVQKAAGWQMLQEKRARPGASNLSVGQQEGERATELVGERMVGCPSAARTADGLALLPPLPPDAQRCAFTAELSIDTWAGGSMRRSRWRS